MKNLKVLSVFLFLLAISPLSGQQINYPYTNVGVSGVVAGTPGTPITVTGANQTIAPTSLVTDIGGTGSIQNITPPSGFTASLAGCLSFNATAAWTTVTGGNIANAITATANTSYQACYDGTTFYISGSGGGGGGAVSSVANSDSTLTISPTTGSVIASLNLAHANTWSAAQTFNALDIFSAGFNLSGTTAPLELSGSAGTSGNCLLSGGAGTTPSWGSCGGSGVTWPATNDLVISNSTNTPTGLAPVNGDCVIGSGGVWVAGSCGGGSSVSSVANSDSTLTISPTTGSVVASLNLAHANTWTAAQALGSSTATTQSLGDNTTKLATDAFVLANGGGQPLGCQSITASSNAVMVNWQSGGCVDINANGAAITSFTFQNPVIGAYYYIGFCNDATARSWSSVPGTFLQAATPQYGSECQRKVYEYTTAGNYQGTGSNATPSIQYGLERSAPATLAAGSFVSWWDSTAHLLCNLDNGSSTQNCTTPNGNSGDLVDYNSSGYTQDSGTLLSGLAPKASPTFSGTITTSLTTAGPVTTSSGGVLSSEAQITAGQGGTGVSNTATLTLGTSNINFAALGTGIVKNTTITGNLTNAAAGTDYQIPISLTTTGSSGAATFNTSTGALNIPQYSGGSGGGGTTGWSGTPLTFAPSGGTQYAPPVGGGATSATESVADVGFPAAATLSKLYVSLSASLGTGTTLAVTLRDNGVSQALTCTTTSGGSSCSDTTHSFNVAQGDLVDFQIVATGTVTAGLPVIIINYAVGTSNVGVTSVALQSASPNLFSGTAGTPVTTSGTLDPDAQLKTQSANCIVAGPSSGSAAAPTCRTQVVPDLPVGTSYSVTPAVGSSDTLSCSSTSGITSAPVAFATTISRPAFTQTSGAKWELRADILVTSTNGPNVLTEVKDGSTIVYTSANSTLQNGLSSSQMAIVYDETFTGATFTSGTLTTANANGYLIGNAGVNAINRTAQVTGYNSQNAATMSILMECSAATAGNSFTLVDMSETRIY